MGNCLKSCRVKEEEEDQREKGKEEENRGMEIEKGEFVKNNVENGNGNNNNGVRVKVVLTKEELQWLMSQINTNRETCNGKKIEDVLEEIEKGRKKLAQANWKPSLHSITETPELIEMNR